MSIIDDITNAQHDFTMRMGFRDADFVIIPFDRIDELKQAFDTHAIHFTKPYRAVSFRRLLDEGEVNVLGVPIFVGAKFGAGSYTR